jgi:hypothetical protein
MRNRVRTTPHYQSRHAVPAVGSLLDEALRVQTDLVERLAAQPGNKRLIRQFQDYEDLLGRLATEYRQRLVRRGARIRRRFFDNGESPSI